MFGTRLQRIVAVTVVLLWTPVAASQTLKLATIVPENSVWMKDMRAGAREIEERTEGRVKFKFYSGGVQGNDKQVRRKMRIGQLHGGAFTSGALTGFQQDSALYSLPLLFSTMDEVTYVRKHLDAELRRRLEDAGYVNFGFSGAGFGFLMSNKPMSTLADLDGQKVWIPEGDQVGYAALKALGVAPVTMPLTDVLTGLQTHLLDSVSTSPVGAIVLQWHTKVRYITDLPVSYVYGTLIIDGKPFSRIQPDDQAVIREIMGAIYTRFDEASIADNEEAMQALLKSGLRLVPPDSGQVPRWRDLVSASNHKMADQGVVSAELLDQLTSLLATYRSEAIAQAGTEESQ